MSEVRFDRLEQSLVDLASKVDEVSKLMETVIRIEEKNIATQQRLDILDVRANKHSEELDQLAKEMSEVRNRGQFNEWFIRGLIASIVTGVILFINTNT